MAKTTTKPKAQDAELFNAPPTAEQAAAGKAVAKPRKVPITETGTNVAKFKPRPTNLLVAFAQAASDPACNPEKMKALSDMVDKMKAEEAEVAFTEAYIDMQEELPSISATGRIEIAAKVGSRGQSTPYAKYDEIMRVIKPILKKYKFALMVVSEPNPSGVGVIVRGTLSRVHETQYGKATHVKQTIIAVPLENSGSKNNVQGIGSSLSYAKRYGCIQLLNIISHAEIDDDRDGHGPKPKKGAAAETVEPEADPNAKITGAQAKELLTAINECGVGPATFLQKYEIDAVHELPARLFLEAKKACADFGARAKKLKRG
jgi:hypothetical protein